MEEFSEDLIPSTEDTTTTTLMSTICNQIFIYKNQTNSTQLTPFLRSKCQNWFLETFEHCSEILTDGHIENPFTLSMILKILSLKFYATEEPITDLKSIEFHPHIRIQPKHMSRTDCNELFIDIAEDYINVATQYMDCTDELLYLENYLIGFFSFFLIFICYKLLRNCKRNFFLKESTSFYYKTEQIKLHKIFCQKKEAAMVGQMLRRAVYECKHLQINKFKPINWNIPNIILKVGREKLVQVLSTFAKSNSIVEKYKNGIIGPGKISSRDYVNYKVGKFLNNSSKLQIVFEIEIESDDDDNCSNFGIKNNFSKLKPIKELCKTKQCKENIIKMGNPPNEGEINLTQIKQPEIQSNINERGDVNIPPSEGTFNFEYPHYTEDKIEIPNLKKSVSHRYRKYHWQFILNPKLRKQRSLTKRSQDSKSVDQISTARSEQLGEWNICMNPFENNRLEINIKNRKSGSSEGKLFKNLKEATISRANINCNFNNNFFVSSPKTCDVLRAVPAVSDLKELVKPKRKKLNGMRSN